MTYRKFVFHNQYVRVIVVVTDSASASSDALGQANLKLRQELSRSGKDLPVLTSANQASTTLVQEPLFVGVTSFSWK